jgi:tetratricopeptide (TPR) repeat protein
LSPSSADARYNFALALKQGGYLTDAAGELERLVSGTTPDSRARLALANLYAQQLRQPAKAREHYNKLLEDEPRHPQADSIRRWLVQNPG